MAEIVRRRSRGGVLPLGRHASIRGSRSIHAPSVSIALSSFQEGQNARLHNRFKREQALAKLHLPQSLKIQGGTGSTVAPTAIRQQATLAPELFTAVGQSGGSSRLSDRHEHTGLAKERATARFGSNHSVGHEARRS